jgi:uncharacterized protein (DUF342 family)
MPLAQMLHFAELRRQGDATATERLALLEQHQHSLEQQMQKLALNMTALQQKIAHKKAFLAPGNAESDSAHLSEKTDVEAEVSESEKQLNKTNKK